VVVEQASRHLLATTVTTVIGFRRMGSRGAMLG
jgi:hypothetical protein